MKELARLTLRGRRGQVVALAATVLFSATLIGAFGLLFETGIRGTVDTGEYGAAPVLVGARQSLPVSSDVAMAIPGRALVPESLVDEITAALPDSRVVADRLAPATFVGRSDQTGEVAAHPWSAFALGERDLTSGRGPEAREEVVVPRHLALTNGLHVGDRAQLAFGDEARTYTVVGLTDSDDTGVDVPDVFLADDEAAAHSPEGRVAAIGVWPARGDDTEALDQIVDRSGARQWSGQDRGAIEVARQGAAKGTVVSAAGAFGALAFIVAVFTLLSLTGLQIRERSRELAMLRVVGATPKQVKQLLRREIRVVALFASLPGAILGPLLGALLVDAIGSWGVLPHGLQPVFGFLPFLVPVLVGVLVAEIAARLALRRIVRGSPLSLLDRPDEGGAGSPRVVLRTALGLAILACGIVMACGPWYASDEAAAALPGLSALVIALALGPLSPVVVRVAARIARLLARRTAPSYLALNSVGMRAVRVGGTLAPIVLGVTLSCMQLFSAVTIEDISVDQVRSGHRADLVVSASGTGVGDSTADLVREVAGVRSADAIVAARVVARVEGGDNSPQTLSALSIASDRVEHYADLGPEEGGQPRLQDGEVALGVQGAATLNAGLGDRLRIVLANGRSISRQVAAVYRNGLGFGEVLLPLADLRAATASGLPTALAVTVADDEAIEDVEARIGELLTARPGLDISRSPIVNEPATAPGEANFQVALLLIIFGYIAIAVVNSLVVATLGRRREFALLRDIGATPAQRRQIPSWEGVFLAITACVVGTLAALPGLVGMTYALSNGERFVPAVDPTSYAVIVALTFALVMTASTLPARTLLHDQTRPE